MVVGESGESIAAFIVEVREIEVGEGVFGVGLDGFAVVVFGLGPAALVEADGAEIDVGTGGLRVQGDGFFVVVDGFGDGAAGLLDGEAAFEALFGVGESFPAIVDRTAFRAAEGPELFERGGVEIEQELPGERVHFLPAEVYADAFAIEEDLQFGEGIGDVLQAFAERLEAAAHAGDGDFFFAERVESAEGE